MTFWTTFHQPNLRTRGRTPKGGSSTNLIFYCCQQAGIFLARWQEAVSLLLYSNMVVLLLLWNVWMFQMLPIQHDNNLCPHNNHSGEHVVHETIDPSLPYDQQEAIRITGEELTSIKISEDPDFINLAVYAMEFEANILANDRRIRDKQHLADAVSETGESRISSFQNAFYEPRDPAFPARAVFAMKQYKVGYPIFLPQGLNFHSQDGQHVLHRDSDPASIRHRIDFCSKIISCLLTRRVSRSEMQKLSRRPNRPPLLWGA